VGASMLPSKERLSKLLGSLYDAAANADLWDVFLKDLVDLMHANAAGLLMHNFRGNRHSVLQQFGLDPNDVRVYYDQTSESTDIWTARARSVIQTGWTGISEDLCAADELRSSEFYNECLRKLNIFHGIFGVIHQGDPFLANISVYRSARRAGFEPAQLEILNFFMPHLHRAFQLHFQLADLRSRNESLERALDMLPSSLLIFDAEGKVLFANRSATDLLSIRDGLLSKRERLRAEQSEQSAVLETIIRKATAAGIGKGVTDGGTAFISRKSGPPLRIVVMPIRGLNLNGQDSAAAVAFVIDPAQRIRPRIEILRLLFGLTPAECRLALLLGDGKSLSEVSQEIGVSRNTVKTQSASIYAKTSTSRQSQLVRLLSQFPDDRAGKAG
jgi:DNA-binding CsgD family transcriptional regulator/PAS domain-containing protein